MRSALTVLRSAFVDLWDNAFLVIFCSLLWLFLTLLIVPGPPATVALFSIGHRIREKDYLVEFRDFFRAAWRNFGVGWRWAAINIPVLLILAVDIRTVPRMLPMDFAVPVQMLFYFVLAIWIIVNWYALAFLFQQQQPGVLQSLRNGGVLFLKYPGFSLLLAVAAAVLLALSLILVMVSMMFGPMLVALISVHAVSDRLDLYRADKRPTD